MKRKTLLFALLAFLGGFLFALPFFLSGASAAILACFSGIPALWLLFYELEDTRRSIWFFLRRGFLFSLGYYLGVYHWFLYLYPLDFIENLTNGQALGVVLFAWIGLSLVATLCFSFIHFNVALLAKTNTVKRHPLLLPPLFASVFTVFSFFISLTWMGVPWGMFSLTQISFPTVIATASLFGNYFVTFIIVLVNGYLAFAVLSLFNGSIAPKKAVFPCMLALGIYLANLLVGTALYYFPHEKSGQVTASVLQGNVSSRDKWVGSDKETLYARYERILNSLVADNLAKEKKTQLIVWSETAIPVDFHAKPLAIKKPVSLWIADFAQKTEACHLTGTFTYDKTGGETTVYNSLYLTRPDGSHSSTVYHKQHLVPFGEYVPWAGFIKAVFPAMAELTLMSDLTPGTDSAVYHEDFGSFGALICFDSIYEPLARSAVRDGAEFLVISTNDSWFENSPALSQHNAQAVMRAVENGRYVLRAANTGISSVITNRGEIVCSLGAMEEGFLTETINTYDYRTPYSIIGNLFVYMLIALLAFLPAPDLLRMITKKK